MQARAPELESNSITFDRSALPKEGLESSSASDDEDADGVDDPLARLAVDPDLSTQARRRSSTGHLNFVDQVSAGIGSYLARLEAKHTENTTVYNRSAGQEASRWQECIRQVPSPLLQTVAKVSSKETSAEGSEDGDEKVGDAARIKLKHPQGGRPVDSELGPCVPPQHLEFESFPGSDGRPRLSFSASFESGNLAVAQCDNPNQYTLLVDVDANTDGYTQWFYFAVRGGTVNSKINFRLINMAKSSSLFGDKGMRPVIWSEKSGRGWERGCSDVSYSATESTKALTSQKNCFTLSFAYTFEFEDDTIFFAYHYPYTYSYLTTFINTLEADPYAGQLFSRKPLCETIGGLSCEALEVDCVESNAPQRGLCVLTARVHPGESNASWMMHGFILFLLSPAAEAIALRQAFKWLIIPMLNPDGVARGSYRCSLAGTDLNRVYLKPNKRIHPEIYHLKEVMKRAPGGVEIFIDFHGHSKKEGIFFYGGKAHAEDRMTNASIQLLPRLCALGSSDFRWNKCSFNVYESKVSTARLVGFLQLKIQKAYTVEASFATSGKVPLEEMFAEDQDENHDRDELHHDKSEEEEEEEEVQHTSANQEMAEAAAAALLQQLASGGEQRNRRDSNSGGNRRKVTRTDLAAVAAAVLAAPESTNPSPRPESPGSRTESRRQRDLVPDEDRQTARNAALRVETPNDTKSKRDEAEARNKPAASEFNPIRLMLAGSTIGRAICASCHLETPLPDPYDESLMDGSEQLVWPHLRYQRLTSETASRELARLASGKTSKDKEPDDDGGSDSNPSADEKPAAELRKIQKRLATKAKRQKTFRIEPEEVEEEVKYKVIVAFGKSMKIPIKPGDKMEGGLSRRNSQVDDAAERFIRVARRHSVQGGEMSPASPESLSRLDHSPCDGDTPANSGRHGDALGRPGKLRVSAFLDVTTSSGFASPRSPSVPSSPVSPLRRRSLRPKSKESALQPSEISFHLPPEPPEDPEASEAGPLPPGESGSGPAATEQPPSPEAASPASEPGLSEPGLSGAGPDVVAGAAGAAAAPSDDPKIDELSHHSDAGSRLSSRRLSSRHRRDVGPPAQELGPILYSPGCPPPASSHAGGSCIQLELSADVGVQAMERRLSSLQAVALSFSRQVSPAVVDAKHQLAEKMAGALSRQVSGTTVDVKQQPSDKNTCFSRQVTPVTADDTWQNVSDALCQTSARKAKVSQIILPEIAGQSPSDQSPENEASPASPDLRARPQRVLISHGPSNFQDWVEQHRAVEHAQPVWSPKQLWVERRALEAPRPASMHGVRKHLSKGKQPSEPAHECGQRKQESRNFISDQNCKPKAPSRVTVHFRTAAPPQRRTIGAVAKVIPGSAAMKPPGAPKTPQGPLAEPSTLRLQPASSDDGASPTCASDTVMPAARPASAACSKARVASPPRFQDRTEHKATLLQLLGRGQQCEPCSGMPEGISALHTARERRGETPSTFRWEASAPVAAPRGCSHLRSGGWARMASE
ncbi:agtpbp1 [Symbiodinium sp. CCMP2456]|nr:agtpbp1 [Symbiodinium sp. CCMP2456]